ncbi:MAG: hypothetical protein ACOCRX_12510 [Candidatus Woesearchaeota archaeon]
MKRVSEIAEELEVSRQTVYNWVDKLSLKDKGYINVKNGVKMVDLEGFKMIKDNVKSDVKEDLQDFEHKDELIDEMKELYEERIKDLKSEVKRLERQLDSKDELIKDQSRQLENFQHLIASKENKIYELEGEVEEKNKSMLQKFKDFFSGSSSDN